MADDETEIWRSALNKDMVPKLRELLMQRRSGLLESLRIPVLEAGGDSNKYLLAQAMTQGQIREVETFIASVENAFGL